MSLLEMSPEVFTADYAGTPGHRTFYLQTRSGGGTYTYLVEKQQVAVLADELRKLLLKLDEDDTVGRTEPARDPALSLQQPAEPDWRVGAMGLAYDTTSDVVMVTMRSVDEETTDIEEQDPSAAGDVVGVALLLRRDQVRAFVLHALAIVQEGRPTCRFCSLPIDPEGHVCPASNGHRG